MKLISIFYLVLFFVALSCKQSTSNTSSAASDSCSIAKKFQSSEMGNKSIKPGYSGTISYYWNDDSSMIKSRHTYKNGELTASTYYYEEGKTRFDYHFRCGALHGLQTVFHENGKIDNLIPYSYGYRNGTGLYYNELGKMTMEVPYSHDSIIHQPVYYDDSGRVKLNVPLNATDTIAVTKGNELKLRTS